MRKRENRFLIKVIKLLAGLLLRPLSKHEKHLEEYERMDRGDPR
jgi:hypothetical protein